MLLRLKTHYGASIEFFSDSPTKALAHEICQDCGPGCTLESSDGTVLAAKEHIFFGGDWVIAWRPLSAWPADDSFGAITLPSAPPEDGDDEDSVADLLPLEREH